MLEGHYKTLSPAVTETEKFRLEGTLKYLKLAVESNASDQPQLLQRIERIEKLREVLFKAA